MIEVLIGTTALLIAFAVTWFLVPIVGRMATAAGIVDLPGARRIHTAPIPRIGGIAVFAGFHLSCLAIYCFASFYEIGNGYLYQHWLSLLAGTSLLLLIGLADDIAGLRPGVKLLGQVVVAVMFFAMDIRVGNLLGFELPPLLDLLSTVAWFVIVINAFNLIDGMDGLATGLASIAALGLIGSFAFRDLDSELIVMVAFLGACIAFLRYNFHPASIFLGDTGSMFLGGVIGTVALCTGSKGAVVASIGVPFLAIGVPLFDTMLAVWRRSVRRTFATALSRGGDGGIMHYDLDHLHHRLIREGLDQRKAALLLYAANLALVVVGLTSLVFSAQAGAIFVTAFVVGAYVVVRHVAYVELWDSGVAFLRGVKAPSNPVLAVLLYPIVDALLLLFSLACAVIVTRLSVTDLSLGQAFAQTFRAASVACGVPFLVLFATRTYERVWSRARIGEFAYLGASIIGGVILAGAINQMLRGSSEEALLYPVEWVLFGALAAAILPAIRAVPRAVRDLMEFGVRHRRGRTNQAARMVVYGAGERGTHYLRRLAAVIDLAGADEGPVIKGFIDDDRNLRGRYVHGYRVIGGYRELARMIRGGMIHEVVLAAPLSDKRLGRLRALALSCGVRLLESRMVMRALVVTPGATGALDLFRGSSLATPGARPLIKEVARREEPANTDSAEPRSQAERESGSGSSPSSAAPAGNDVPAAGNY